MIIGFLCGMAGRFLVLHALDLDLPQAPARSGDGRASGLGNFGVSHAVRGALDHRSAALGATAGGPRSSPRVSPLKRALTVVQEGKIVKDVTVANAEYADAVEIIRDETGA